jgi:hypothetical protein
LHQYFIAGFDTGEFQADMESCSAVDYSDSMPGAREFGEIMLEAINKFSDR